MVLIQGVFAAIFRSLGKLLNTAFGWATVMLFGKVSESRQIYLSAITFGSVAWLALLAGVLIPSVGTFLLGMVTLPKWVDETWVRLAMLIGAIALPSLVGVASILMLDPEDRPKGAGTLMAILKGYPYTLGMALTLVMMTAFAPILKLRDLVKRWTTSHVPIIVEPVNYSSVVNDVRQALCRGGLTTRTVRATWLLRLPTSVLTFFAGGAVERLVAGHLTTLVSPNLEVLLHPSDLVISGRQGASNRARAILTEVLTFTRAYLTWDKEANHVEDQLRAIWHALEQQGARFAPAGLERLRLVSRELERLELPYEEWEVLFRERMQVERELLRLVAGLDSEIRQREAVFAPAELAKDFETVPALPGPRGRATAEGTSLSGLAAGVGAFAGALIAAIDLLRRASHPQPVSGKRRHARA